MEELTEQLEKDAILFESFSISRLGEFEHYRKFTQRALKKAVQSSLNDVSIDSTVLEIGSGLAYMRRFLVPEWEGTWHQLDNNPKIIEEAKSLYPQGTYVEAPAKELPFDDNSIDVVCGLGSFDVFHDLDGAVNEAYRVLKPGGKFFHVLDLIPAEFPISVDLQNQGVKIIEYDALHEFDDGRVSSIAILPEDLDPDSFDVFDFDAWKDLGKPYDMHEHFRAKMDTSLSRKFQRVSAYMKRAEVKAPQTSEQKEFIQTVFVGDPNKGLKAFYNSTRYSVSERGTLKTVFLQKAPVLGVYGDFSLGLLDLIPDRVVNKAQSVLPEAIGSRLERRAREIVTVNYAEAYK